MKGKAERLESTQRKRDIRMVGFDLPSAKKQTERVVDGRKPIMKDKMDPSKNSTPKKKKKMNTKKGKKKEGRNTYWYNII